MGNPSQRPLSITVIAILYVIGTITQLISLNQDILVFGNIVSGISSVAVSIIYITVFVYCIIGLWRLVEKARLVSMGFQVYAIINLVINWMALTAPDGLGVQAGFDPNTLSSVRYVGIIIVCIPSLIVLFFLIKRKPAFQKASSSAK